MKDLISVVVTCYNHQDYIEQCLRSIFAQTYRNIELLVLDDGSSDHSAEIIEAVLADSPFPTRFESHENMGVVKTRNKALQQIQGTYFIFVDSDDFLDVDYIESFYTSMLQEEADIVYGDLYDPDKKEVYLKSQPYDKVAFLTENFISNCSLIRRSISDGIYYDEALNREKLEDYDFLLNLIINQGAKPVYDAKTKLNYRVFDKESISKRDSTRYHYEMYLKILRKYVRQIPDDIYQALGKNIFTLEGRLDELIQHMDKVNDYVLELQEDQRQLHKNLDSLKSRLRTIKEQRDDAIQEQFRIRRSISYRLGNGLITPLKRLARLVKNPRSIKVVLSRIKQQLVRLKRNAKSPKVYYYQRLRNSQREKALASVSSGEKVLVYVIFESEPRLQQYKTIFLEKLAALADKTLIVVNGGLAEEDLETLEQYGQVLVRDNSGYDTAAFREGILSLGKETLQHCSQLILVNDTNIGPMSDLAAVFQTMAGRNLDFWGISFGETQEDITGFNRYGYIPNHLQSYFLVIEPLLLQSEEF